MNQKLERIYESDKYNEMFEYLKQKNEDCLDNDKCNIIKKYDNKYNQYLDFSIFKNNTIKLELKYSIIYILENQYLTTKNIAHNGMAAISRFGKYLTNIKHGINTLKNFNSNSFKMYLFNLRILKETTIQVYMSVLNTILFVINSFFDDKEETEKDIWNCLKMPGARISATASRRGYTINFLEYPKNYRECMKKYFKTIITKKSLAHCLNLHLTIVAFFTNFQEMGYKDNFLKQLKREDIEKYIYHIKNKYVGKNATYVNKLLAYPRIFLEYIQLANYDEAPTTEISFLIFKDDMPKRERYEDTLKKVKFIPELILQQLETNIMELDRSELIPIYVLLRETGWRGTDIFNLRYDNCLEKIWNAKENRYNYYLCGEITKTGIPMLKIPIRNTVAQMLEENINNVKEISNEDNNPNKYLFNVYSGKLKGYPIPKMRLTRAIERLIQNKNIKDESGKLYHFRLHSLRHTRAKEYVEQGMNLSIIQQILGHRSLQMTMHYATVTENTLYEQWKNTEDLNLFRIADNNKKQKIDTKENEELVRYEYVRKNLDAVKVPFGVCFKPSKLPCKQQINQCLTCASFCTTKENLQEYEEEIARVEEQIKISEKCGRTLWKEKNEEYLKLLKEMVSKIEENHIVHKNGNSREEN